jgi:hypothetical protein
MPLHESTFDYHKPTEEQIEKMAKMRAAAKEYADHIEQYVPAGPDRTYILRHVRTTAMWVNVAITRNADGAPWQEG